MTIYYQQADGWYYRILGDDPVGPWQTKTEAEDHAELELEIIYSMEGLYHAYPG